MKVVAEAPSNIALIKYMGKIDGSGNRPSNPSLSYTLGHLFTRVEIEKTGEGHLESSWEPLQGLYPIALSEKGKSKFLNHFKFLCGKWGIQGRFTIRSANNFPAACGLASSASSFAALTRAVAKVAEVQAGKSFSDLELSRLSRQGSGSSCRSFFSPWAIWREEGAEPMDLPLKTLRHSVVLAETAEKSVSSSQAHQKVVTSLLFNGRVERVEQRLKDLTSALKAQQWRDVFEITWAEFWDMHALFETSRPSFGYMNAKSMLALTLCREMWEQEQDGPIVTMDAGPNVHLLFRDDQSALQENLLKKLKSHDLEVWKP